jgi:NAD kinase
MEIKRVLVVRKMSALEYYYNGNHKSKTILDSHENHSESVERIRNLLKNAGIAFDVITRKELSEELVSNYDAVISAGGDGTAIAIAAYNKDKPQLNIKTDSKSTGALCQTEIEYAIKALIQGRYRLEEWQRQDIYINGKFIGRASNETCVGEKMRFDQLARYELEFFDVDLSLIKSEIQSASGIVIVTGTGSSAWPAAFKPFSKEARYFEFKTLLQHSGVIKNGKANYFRIIYKGHEGKFSLDTKDFDFPRDSVLEIKPSDNPLRVIVPLK